MDQYRVSSLNLLRWASAGSARGAQGTGHRQRIFGDRLRRGRGGQELSIGVCGPCFGSLVVRCRKSRFRFPDAVRGGADALRLALLSRGGALKPVALDLERSQWDRSSPHPHSDSRVCLCLRNREMGRRLFFSGADGPPDPRLIHFWNSRLKPRQELAFNLRTMDWIRTESDGESEPLRRRSHWTRKPTL